MPHISHVWILHIIEETYSEGRKKQNNRLFKLKQLLPSCSLVLGWLLTKPVELSMDYCGCPRLAWHTWWPLLCILTNVRHSIYWFLSGNKISHISIYTTCECDWQSPIAHVPAVYATVRGKLKERRKRNISRQRRKWAGHDEQEKRPNISFPTPDLPI